MEENEDKLPPARPLDEYTLNQLEVKRRKCQEDLEDAIKYSWGHRASEKIGYNIYKIAWYLSLIGIVLMITSVIFLILPAVFNPSEKNQMISTLNPWTIGLLFGGIILFMFTSNISLNDPARPLRRKLADLEQVIRIKQDVERGDNFSIDEDEHTEYKTSFKYDIQTGNPNTILVKEVVISVLGFLNAIGGRVVIGVSPSKEIVGIENDLKLFGDWDKFQLAIIDSIQNHSDRPLSEFFSIKKGQKNGKELCIISSRPYPKPVFYIDGNNQELYVREGNRTRKLSTKEAFDYITSHWVDKGK